MINWEKVKEYLTKLFHNEVKGRIQQEVVYDYKDKKSLKFNYELTRTFDFYKISKNIWYCCQTDWYYSSYGSGLIIDERTNEIVEIDADSTLFEPNDFIEKHQLTISVTHKATMDEYISCVEKELEWYRYEDIPNKERKEQQIIKYTKILKELKGNKIWK